MKIERLNEEKEYKSNSVEYQDNSLISPLKKEDELQQEGFEYVLEEISEVQTSLVKFFTLMFEIGILLIPIQIIIYEDIKPYEIIAIHGLQNVFNLSNLNNFSFYIYKIILSFSSINFLTSFNVFIYFFTDTLVSLKVCFLLGSCSYIVYVLKLIIHDSRPFWIDPLVTGIRCKTSFGCPSLDVFTGMFYFNFLIFNLAKRNKKKLDPNLKWLLRATKYISLIFIGLNVLIGFIHILFGENFIYQVIFSIFYVYLFLRVIITFDELINHYTKNAREEDTTSRMVSINIFFCVLIFSILSLVFYSITSYDLTIPLIWSENIAKSCPRDLITEEISTKNTLLESCSIFQVSGAAFGLNIVLYYIKNNNWEKSTVSMRLLKGGIGFIINMMIVYSKNFFLYKSLATDYILSSLIFFLSGIISYGFLPVLFNNLKMNSQEVSREITALNLKNLNIHDKIIN